MHILDFSLNNLDGDLMKIDIALSLLTIEQVWKKVKPSTNSIGNLCLHLAGAEYQRMYSAISGNALERKRSKEFEEEGGWTPEQLSTRLHEVRQTTKQVFENLQQADLQREVEVYFRQDDWNKMFKNKPQYGTHPAYKPQQVSHIILGVVSHYSYHTGQIVLLTKMLQEKDTHLFDWKH